MINQIFTGRGVETQAYHHVLDSAFRKSADFFEFVPGSRLIPMARAVRIARPIYIYDTAKDK
jgi:fatty-acid desaturase